MDNTLLAVTIFSVLLAGVVMVLFLTTFFRHKISNISTFIISMLIYVAFVFVGQNVWILERFGLISEDQGDIARFGLRSLSSLAGVLAIRYFLLPPNEYGGKNVWAYVVGVIAIISAIFFFFPPEISHVK